MNQVYFEPITKFTKNTDGTLTLNITPPDNAITETSKIYALGVDNTRLLLDLGLTPALSNEEITIPYENVDSVKIFVWDESMKPLTIMQKIDIK